MAVALGCAGAVSGAAWISPVMGGGAGRVSHHRMPAMAVPISRRGRAALMGRAGLGCDLAAGASWLSPTGAGSAERVGGLTAPWGGILPPSY